MGYYMGDYYGRGSYYRGDPGFFSFLGGIARKAVGLIPGVGPAISTAIEAVAPRGGTVVRPGGVSAMRTAGRAVGTMVAKHPVLSAAGGAAVLAGAGAGIERMAAGPGIHKGMHLNKHGKLVRNRHMRVTNPKALRRAIRRAHGFAKMARKCISFTSAHPPKGRMYFKHRKRK